MNRYQLTIDVGSASGTGWILWNDPLSVKVIDHGLIIPVGNSWVGRCDYICEQMRTRLKQWRPNETLVEYPQFMQSKTGRHTAEKGDLVKLAVLTGRIFQVVREYSKTALFISVSDWKGVLKKPQVQERVTQVLGHEACKGFHRDVWDAAGIGIAARGLL